jgi:hypothetical protein
MNQADNGGESRRANWPKVADRELFLAYWTASGRGQAGRNWFPKDRCGNLSNRAARATGLSPKTGYFA